MSPFGLAVLGSIIGSILLSFKTDDVTEVDLINEILKNNLKIKKGDEEVYAYIYKCHKDIYYVNLPNGLEFSQLSSLKGKIENALHRYVEIKNKDFTYTIQLVEISEIPSEVNFEIVPTRQKKSVRVGVGVGHDGYVYLDFKKTPHLLVAGATGYGKSIFTKNLILQIISNYPNVELELFDFKAGIELKDFKHLKQTKCFIAKSHLAANELQRIYNEIEERFDLITNADCRDVYEYNDISENKLSTKFVVLEEFTILIDMQKEISTVLVKSLAISRAVGIHFLVTSQRFDSKIIDSKIKANIDGRVCFRTADAVNSRLILDTTGAEQINRVGRAILSSCGEIQEFQSFFVTKHDVQSVTSKFNEHKSNELKDKKVGDLLWG